jgi:hypothetical protein
VQRAEIVTNARTNRLVLRVTQCARQRSDSVYRAVLPGADFEVAAPRLVVSRVRCYERPEEFERAFCIVEHFQAQQSEPTLHLAQAWGAS